MRKNINLNDIAHFMVIVRNYRMMTEELDKIGRNPSESRSVCNLME